MSDLILPEHMAKARRKEKAKIAEKGKTAVEKQKKSNAIEEIKQLSEQILSEVK